MRPVDIRDLIGALMTLIGISIAIGQYDELKEWAKREAVRATKGWEVRRVFPVGYGSRK